MALIPLDQAQAGTTEQSIVNTPVPEQEAAFSPQPIEQTPIGTIDTTSSDYTPQVPDLKTALASNLNQYSGNANILNPSPDLSQQNDTSPTMGQTFKAAWQRNTFTGSLATFGINDNTVTDPNYNAAAKLRDTPYWIYADQAVGVNSDAQLQIFKQNIDKENQLATTMAQSGTMTSLVANMAAQFGDILTYIPMLGLGTKLAKAGSIAKGMLEGATGGAAIIGGQELGIQQTQKLRTADESILNVATAAVFSGILGGAIGHFTSDKPIPSDSEPASIVKGVLNNNDSPVIEYNPGKSAGAAFTNSFGDDSHIAGMTVKAFGKSYDMTNLVQVPYLHAPVLDGLAADSNVLNNVTSAMFEHSIFERKNTVTPEMNKEGSFGIATSQAVDTMQKLDRVDVYNFHRDLRNIYLDYAQTKPGPLEAMRSRFNTLLSGKKSFNDLLADAADTARNGDVSDNPHVTRMASVIRDNIEKANQQMAKAGVPQYTEILEAIKNNPSLDDSYYPRVYNKQAILNDRPGFEAILQDHFMTQKSVSETGEEGQLMSPKEAKTQVQKTTDNILGAGEQDALLSDISRMSLDKGVNFTKERTLPIPSNKVSDYLVNDPMRTVSQYMTQASQLSRFQEMLNSFGVEKFSDVKAELQSEGEARMLALDSTDKNYALNKKNMTEKYVKYQNTLQDNMAVLLGQYAKRTKWDSFFQFLRNFNYIRLMGRIVINSSTDIAMPILKHGLGATLKSYGQGLVNIATGLRSVENNALRHLGVALDQEIDGALRTIIDPDFGSNLVMRQPKIGTGIQSSVKKLYDDLIYGANITMDRAGATFSNLNLVNYWNTFHQRLAARTAISEILSYIHDYTNITAKQKTYLNSIGIGADDIKPILTQFERHGATDKGAFVSDIQTWDNRAAAEKFANAIIKEVDSTIIRPGKGDMPLVVHSGQIGKTMLQFKAFFSTMTTKMVVTSLQRHDSNTLQGVVGLLSLGALQYLMVQKLNGKEPDTSTNNLLLEGINRSGLLGLLGDPIFGIILNNKMGGGSRYIDQNWIEYMLGPSASLVKTTNKVFNDVKEGKADDKTLKAAESLIPFQNLFYLRLLFDKANGK